MTIRKAQRTETDSAVARPRELEYASAGMRKAPIEPELRPSGAQHDALPLAAGAPARPGATARLASPDQFDVTGYFSAALVRGYLHDRSQAPMFRDEINVVVRRALTNGWVTLDDFNTRWSAELRGAGNASDLNQLSGKIGRELADPETKMPEPVVLESHQHVEAQAIVDALADVGFTKLREGVALNDDGRSIIFFDPEDGSLHSGHSRRELSSVFATLPEPEAAVARRLFGLGEPSDAARQGGATMLRHREKGRALVSKLMELPPMNREARPAAAGARVATIFQGSATTVTTAIADYIGTFGLGNCVGVVVAQPGRVLVAHIDNFEERTLSGRTGRQLLNATLNGFDDSARVYLIGGGQNGDVAVREIAAYLEQRGLLSRVVGADVLSNAQYVESVTVEVATGRVFAGVDPLDYVPPK